MSIILKEKEGKYSESNYYRSNPYSNQGYIPPVSLRNRKQPEHLSEIPQGIEYFQTSSKKHYPERSSQNTIGYENILSHAQRYPLENTLANDKQFLRNLCTLDIQGANANSKKSMGVKNRIKAQEQLLRRNAPIITPLIFNGNTQELVRRKLASQQFQRQNSRESRSLDSKSRNYHSQTNLHAVQYYNKNPYVKKKDFAMQFQMDDILNKKLLDNGNSNRVIIRKKQRGQNEFGLLNTELQREIKINTQRQELHSNESKGYYPSNEQIANPEGRDQSENEKKKLQAELIERLGRNNGYRMINPTNLSYEGAFIRKSGILSSLGRNILLG